MAERIKQRWSPHAISADVKTFGYSVSAETIYRPCYANSPCSGLQARSLKKLPTQRRRRRRRSRCEQAKRSPLGPYRPLSARPAEAAGRSEGGHWEGDLIIAARNATAAVTLVERLSRYTLIAALDDRLRRRQNRGRSHRRVEPPTRPPRQDPHLGPRHRVARWADVETGTRHRDVYFCEPRSPWQRPSNEQTNGLLRRWLPKGTNLDVGPLRLAITADNLNQMPRKLHNWKSAHTMYTQQNCNHH